jgi:hypothetical protein
MPPPGGLPSVSAEPQTVRDGTSRLKTGGLLTRPHTMTKNSPRSEHGGMPGAKPSVRSLLTPRSTWWRQRTRARPPRRSAPSAYRYEGGPRPRDRSSPLNHARGRGAADRRCTSHSHSRPRMSMRGLFLSFIRCTAPSHPCAHPPPYDRHGRLVGYGPRRPSPSAAHRWSVT